MIRNSYLSTKYGILIKRRNKMEAVSTIQELIRVIGANSSKESVLVEIETWDGRVVRGSSYRGPKVADVVSIVTTRIDSNLLWSYVKNLVEKEKSFIVKMGSSCNEWTISDN